MKRLTLLIAIAFIAAACGGGASSSTFESLDATDSSTLTPSAGGDTSTSTTSAGLPESDYPDVVVADLAGGEVNLRELALEAEPVLLWFWAPH